MLVRRLGYVLLGFTTIVGCSSSKNGQAGSGACNALPPPNVNLTLCANITGSSDITQLDNCLKCCETGGYTMSSFTDTDQCVCAKTQDDAGATICADQIATSNGCQTCCTSAGYSGFGWVGDMSCQCDSKHDASICNNTLAEPAPDKACACCCLNHGYISYVYSAIGQPECNCHGI